MLIWINENVGFQPSFSRQGHCSRNACLCSFGLTKTISPRAFVASVVSAFCVDSLRDEPPCISTEIGETPFQIAADKLAYYRVPVHDAHRIQFRGRVNGAARLLSQLHHDTTAHSICQVTKRILDAVVPFIALRPQAVSWLRHEVIIVGKGKTFLRDFCGLQLRFTDCCC